MWMTERVRTSAAKGSMSRRKGRLMAQPTSTITGSTNIAICAQQQPLYLSVSPC